MKLFFSAIQFAAMRRRVIVPRGKISLFLFVVLFSITTPIWAMNESDSRLIVASNKTAPPFSFLDPNGAPRGILIDIWEMWSRKTGIPVEFRLMDWSSTLKAVREGRADVVGGMFQMPEREPFFDYGGKLLKRPAAIFFHHHIAGIKGIEDLAGFKVGIVRGDSAEEWLRSTSVGIDRVSYSDVDAMVRDAMAGRIKVFVADAQVSRFFLAQHADGDSFLRTSDIFANFLRAGVRKGNRTVLATVASGFERISQSEIDAIVAQWTGHSTRNAFSWIVFELSLLAAVSLSVAALLWNLSLRRRVTAAIKDIAEKNRELEKSHEALALSEKKFRLIFENAPYAITINRLPDGKYLDANNAFLESQGIHKEELWRLDLPGRASTYMSEDDRQAVFDALMRTGVVRNAETTMRKKNGTIANLYYSSVLMDVDGNPQALSMVVDVAEKVKTRRALRKSEENFRSIFDHAPIGIFRTSFDGTMLEGNATIVRMFGYASRDELLASVKNISTVFYPTPKDRQRLLDALVETPQGVRMEIEFRHRDGSPFYAIMNASLQMDADHRPVFINGTIEDITSLKRAEMELRRLAEAVEQSGESIVITDPNGVILYANRAFEQITGYSRQEAIGQKPSLLKSGRQDDAFYFQLWKTIASGKTWRGRFVNKRKDGSLFTEDATISSVCAPNGQIVNYVAVKRDITKEIETEKKLELAQKMEAIGTLSSGIAHDFNNLLFPIIGMSEILMDDLPVGSEDHEYAEEIHKAGMRGSDLIRQILSFSRQVSHKKMPVRIQGVLKEVIKLARATIPANIEISQHIQDDCPMVLMDASQLHQVTMNLIINAYHAIEENGGSISIGLKEYNLKENDLEYAFLAPGKYALVSIADTGHGIDPSIKERIFQPYFTTKAQGKGTGLGLSMVYGIVKEVGGYIDVQSEVGQGTTFKLFIPLIEYDRDEDDLYRESPLPTGNERILLVDDDPAVMKLEQEMLGRLGYHVTSRTGSPEALEIFAKNPDAFDLIITDMAMPKMTGEQFAKEINAIDPCMPIIILTGFGDRINKESASSIGIKGILMKPVAKFQLAKMVHEVIEKHQLKT